MQFPDPDHVEYRNFELVKNLDSEQEGLNNKL
jgi:hypothetical protein